MYECYDGIIGLSNEDCDCTATDRPVDYNQSQSGLFLSSLTNISALIRAGKCNESMWDLISNSLEVAKHTLVAESNALLIKKHTLKRKPIPGIIVGQIKKKNNASLSKNYALIRINCCPVRGGLMTINSINTVFNATGAFTVSLYNNVDGFIQDIPVNSTAGKNTKNAITIPLPTYSKYVDTLEYYLVYQVDENNLPRDTKIDCGCGGTTFNFTTKNPYYIYGNRYRNAPWSQYVMIGGLQINSLTELDYLDDTESATNNMYGINLDLSFTCKVDEVLCDESLDFIGNPLAMSLSFALLYLTASIIAREVQRSPNLNRETMINIEQWEEDELEWKEKYMEHITYIVDNIDQTGNDCLACKNLLEITRQGLFA